MELVCKHFWQQQLPHPFPVGKTVSVKFEQIKCWLNLSKNWSLELERNDLIYGFFSFQLKIIYANLVILATPVRVIDHHVVSLGH